MLKFDLDVRWTKSEQWVTFQIGEHTWITALGHILSLPDSAGVGELEFQAFVTHFFQQLLDGLF